VKVVVARSKQNPFSNPRKEKKVDIIVLEAPVISALRMGDVRKALQMLNSAPIAPKTDATFQRLRDLHPKGPTPASIQTHDTPHLTDDVVRAALSSFGPGSAAGLFGYKPALLQQAARAETFNFGSQLARCVNQFASGSAPEFLIPFIAGGVSIALEKSATAVRPLACGDPIRRLVGKCFCIAGKTEISKSFAGQNYGVGCKGGVEVVAHSLRDALNEHKDSALGLLKIDFKNAFNPRSLHEDVKRNVSLHVGLSGVWNSDHAYDHECLSQREI
jgi:hypothetical protein